MLIYETANYTILISLNNFVRDVSQKNLRLHTPKKMEKKIFSSILLDIKS